MKDIGEARGFALVLIILWAVFSGPEDVARQLGSAIHAFMQALKP